MSQSVLTEMGARVAALQAEATKRQEAARVAEQHLARAQEQARMAVAFLEDYKLALADVTQAYEIRRARLGALDRGDEVLS